MTKNSNNERVNNVINNDELMEILLPEDDLYDISNKYRSKISVGAIDSFKFDGMSDDIEHQRQDESGCSYPDVMLIDIVNLFIENSKKNGLIFTNKGQLMPIFRDITDSYLIENYV